VQSEFECPLRTVDPVRQYRSEESRMTILTIRALPRCVLSAVPARLSLKSQFPTNPPQFRSRLSFLLSQSVLPRALHRFATRLSQIVSNFSTFLLPDGFNSCNLL
jgi:hypothetical protein